MNSLRETILFALRRVQEIKEENVFAKVTILTRHKELTHSVNRIIQEENLSFVALHIETLEQHIHRVTENFVYGNNQKHFDFEDQYFTLQKTLRENKFSYFKSVIEFNSYAYYFTRLIQELRLSAPDKAVLKALQNLNAIDEKNPDLKKIKPRVKN